jgi:pyruvate,water dikinase
MRGTSACGGRATAPAAVLADVSESHLLTRGDVLVTRQTDPGWGPVFCLISGLVIERGGMLSHGAILAREFGLPCIVGVKDATRRIPHGARVTVDGDGGTCSIAEPALVPPRKDGRT